MAQPLIKIDNISKSFKTGNALFSWNQKSFVAINKITFQINEGEIYSLLGKTGSGKSTIGYCLAGLLKPDTGRIFYKDTCINEKGAYDFQKLRGEIQIVFQDPSSSLNPVHTIQTHLREILFHYKIATKTNVEIIIDDLLTQTGISPSDKFKYPSEFSTGQKQRICIARALASHPKFVILDEVTSSLDVINQNNITGLLMNLREKYNISYLFITHNLRQAKSFSDRFAFINEGKIIMEGARSDLTEEFEKNYYR